MSERVIAGVTWRKSSFSGNGGSGTGGCVEAACLPDGRRALRDSKSPASGVIALGRSAMSVCLAAVKAGAFDGRG